MTDGLKFSDLNKRIEMCEYISDKVEFVLESIHDGQITDEATIELYRIVRMLAELKDNL